MVDRRRALQGMGSILALASQGLVPKRGLAADLSHLTYGLPEGLYETAELDILPGKKPLIKLTYRPPNYETPVSYFESPITANDAFFVRYHLADIPQEINLQSWKLRVDGDGVTTPFELAMADLQKDFEEVEILAVCQCAGNRRGLSDPHVPGVQWGLGAMGCAVWKGVRLKDVLAKAGLRKETVEIILSGADRPTIDKTPEFIKSIPLWKALDENTIIAFAMNGEPLPHFNGFPARLIVPGWTATYWMKHLVTIEASTKPFGGFWVKSAYRVPTGKFPMIQHFLTQMNESSEPITEILVNSVIASPAEGYKLRPGEPVDVRGVAWDGGYGVRRVEFSTDGGKLWREADLGKDLGRFAFRSFGFRFVAATPGTYKVMVRASNALGQTQAESLIFNPAGYHNNVIRPLTISVV